LQSPGVEHKAGPGRIVLVPGEAGGGGQQPEQQHRRAVVPHQLHRQREHEHQAADHSAARVVAAALMVQPDKSQEKLPSYSRLQTSLLPHRRNFATLYFGSFNHEISKG